MILLIPLTLTLNFYPRSPCGERLIGNKIAFEVGDFYPRSPCGERPTKSAQGANSHGISIHALLAESDLRKVPLLGIK